MSDPLRIAFVPGVTPDKWARIWRERRTGAPLELSLVDEADQRRVLDEEEADMCLARLPLDQEGLHLVRLYDEQPVVVVPRDHPVSVYDEIDLTDLVDEHLVVGDPPGWAELRSLAPLHLPGMSLAEAFEVIASGTGVGIVPTSVARLHHRKDLVSRSVTGVPWTTVGLAWPRTLDDDRTEDFIGIVRGRRAGSSRGRGRLESPGKPTASKTAARPRDGSRSGRASPTRRSSPGRRSAGRGRKGRRR